jgi:hypothetical protein
MFGGTHFLKTRTPQACARHRENAKKNGNRFSAAFAACAPRGPQRRSSSQRLVLGTSRRRCERAPALALKRHSHASWIIPRSLFPSCLPSLFLVARCTAVSCERNEAPQNPHRRAAASRNAVTALRAIGSRPAPPAARCARIGICGHLGPGDAFAIAQRRGGHQALMLVIKRHDADPTDRLVVDIGKARCASRAAPATRRAYLRAA